MKYNPSEKQLVILLSLLLLKKNLLHQGSNQGPSDQKPVALPDELLRLCCKSVEFLGFLYLKLHKCSTVMVLHLKMGGGTEKWGGGTICPLVEIGLTYLPKCKGLQYL